ncbi:MAG: cell division protein FtsL [Corallincola sp.]|nr:cell division protein FtsL [Corallincola sp.]
MSAQPAGRDRQPDLALTIVADLGRYPLVMLLAVATLVSAFAVVLAAHHARLVNIEVERELARRDQLEIEWRHLLLEENALGEHSRVGRIAEKELQMRLPGAIDERIVRLP